MIWILIVFGLVAINLGWYLVSHQTINLFVAGFGCDVGTAMILDLMDRRGLL